MMPAWVRNFFFPELKRSFWIRLGLVSVVAYGVFGHVCILTRNRGRSMEPTYADGAFNFCWRPRFLFSAPQAGDVVIVRLAGLRVMVLKRVVATAGDTVEFRDGYLFVNGKRQEEPYVRHRGNWNLPPRTVKPGHIYVVGDNRGMPMAEHAFGQTPVRRVKGGPLL